MSIIIIDLNAFPTLQIDLVANHLATELPSDSNFHTTATLQIFEEFSNVCRESITTTLLEVHQHDESWCGLTYVTCVMFWYQLLLLPFSASDVANKLLDIALGAMPTPSATSVVGIQPTTQGHMTAAAPAPSVLDALMQVEYSAASSSPSSMLELLDMDTATGGAPSSSEPILTTDAFPATVPAATLYAATIAPGTRIPSPLPLPPPPFGPIFHIYCCVCTRFHAQEVLSLSLNFRPWPFCCLPYPTIFIHLFMNVPCCCLSTILCSRPCR